MFVLQQLRHQYKRGPTLQKVWEESTHADIPTTPRSASSMTWIFSTNYGPIKGVRVWKKTKDIDRKIALGKVIFTHPNWRIPFASHETFQRETCFKGDHSESFEMYFLKLSDIEGRCQITEMFKQLPGRNSKTIEGSRNCCYVATRLLSQRWSGNKGWPGVTLATVP